MNRFAKEEVKPLVSQSLDSRHNFTSKLLQASLIGNLRKYVEYQRLVRKVFADGRGVFPAWPETWGPISINLDLTTACNYACTHCIDWDMLNSKVKYEHEQLIASLKTLIDSGLRSVILIGGGEPTLYPGFREVVRYLKGYGMQVGIVSNGSRVGKIVDIAPLLTDPRDWVRFSLDSGTDETFTAMHQPKGSKKATLSEICAESRLIREQNLSLQFGFSYIITWEGAAREETATVIPNIDEMEEAAELAKRSGFNYISFKPFLFRHPDGAEILDTKAIAHFGATLDRIRRTVSRIKRFEDDTFRVIESTNLRVLLDGSWKDFTDQPRTCHANAFRLVLSPLGLFNCPAHRGEAKGRVAEKDAFAGSAALAQTGEALAQSIVQFDAHHECREVVCLYNSVNWFIEELVTGDRDLDELEAIADRGDFFL